MGPTGKILGISAFYHDSAASLVNQGHIERAAQEERFTRKKHDPSFPINAIKFCLQGEKGEDQEGRPRQWPQILREIDGIVFYDKPFLTFERLLENYLKAAPFKGFASFREAMPLWMGKKLNMRSLIKKELKKSLSVSQKDIPEIWFNYHHLSHAASAFYPSPFQRAAVLCLDGAGEWATSSGWLGEGSGIHPLWQINFPHSLGLLYSTFTEYCGFKVNSGEYKLMGLAPYGEARYVPLFKENLIEMKEDGSFSLNMDYFDYPFRLRMANPRLYQLLGKGPRNSQGEEQIDRHYMDVACSVQRILEEAVFKMARSLHKETKADSLCLAGGVALNCAANGKILKNSPFSSLWTQPAAGDAGGAIGAALSAWHQHFQKPRRPKKPDSMRGALLGPEYRSEAIKKILDAEGRAYTALPEEDLIETAAEALIQGKIIGWHQGKMEFGPRALGSRSILADPRSVDMQSKINQKIKRRESFRPFAISILKREISAIFEEAENPYMLLTAFIRPDKRKNESLNSQKKGLEKLSVARSSLPAVTHVDYSTRIQTVGEEADPRYRKLIERFFKKTGCPGILNTSFNVRGEPIIHSPSEALRCFLDTDMDLLFLGDFVIKKEGAANKRLIAGETEANPASGAEGGASKEGFLRTLKSGWIKGARAWNQTVIFLFLLIIWVLFLTPTKYARRLFQAVFFPFRANQKRRERNSFFKKPAPLSADHFSRPF